MSISLFLNLLPLISMKSERNGTTTAMEITEMKLPMEETVAWRMGVIFSVNFSFDINSETVSKSIRSASWGNRFVNRSERLESLVSSLLVISGMLAARFRTCAVVLLTTTKVAEPIMPSIRTEMMNMATPLLTLCLSRRLTIGLII